MGKQRARQRVAAARAPAPDPPVSGWRAFLLGQAAGLAISPLIRFIAAFPLGFAIVLQPLFCEARATGADENVGDAAVPLQRVHQAADGADQRAGAAELVEFVDLATAGGDEEAEAGGHGKVMQSWSAAPVARPLSLPCKFHAPTWGGHRSLH